MTPSTLDLKNLPDKWKTWSPQQRLKLLELLDAEERERLLARLDADGTWVPWEDQARPKQLPPDHPRHHQPDARGFRCGCSGIDENWYYWFIMAGRGTGKTRTGAAWLAKSAGDQPHSFWAIIAPTFRDVRATCIEGESGILRAIPPAKLASYRRNELEIRLTNGAIIYGFSADRPERVRGANLYGAWCDELGSWRYEETWHEGLVPALRKGAKPRIVITTTPRPTPLIRDLTSRTDGSVHITRATTWENEDHLSPTALAELRRRYTGTRIGRQELEGELLDDVEGALWKRAVFDDYRVDRAPTGLVRVVVAVDPAVTSTKKSDWTGIVVAGIAEDGDGYVLADLSMKDTPLACMQRAVWAYKRWSADRIVGEVNNGGDFIEALLRTVNTDAAYRSVRASRGKFVRAEPVSALYEQGRIHHVGAFAELEDQCCTWVPNDGQASPDRLDALVWAFTDLKELSIGEFDYGGVACRNCGTLFMREPNAGKCPACHQEAA